MRSIPPARRPWAWGLASAAAVVAAISAGILLLPQAPSLTPPREVLPPGPTASSLESLTFVSASVAWAVLPAKPYWRVVRSSDGGLEWLDVTPPGNGTNGGLELTVFGPEQALVVYPPYDYQRDSAFAYTEDGGQSWRAAILPGAASRAQDAVTLQPDGEVWAVLANGEVFQAQGVSGAWKQLPLPAAPSGSCAPTSIGFSGADWGWLSASCQGTAGLWRSSDGGAEWQFQSLAPMVPDPGQVSLVPLSLGGSGTASFAAVSSRTHLQEVRLLSWAKGSWSSVASLAVPRGRLLTSFASSGQGWVVDLPTTKGAYALAYQTADGGEAWSLRTLPLLSSQVGAVSVGSSGRAYLLVRTGSGGYLWESANSGGSWHESGLHVFSGDAPVVNGVSS